MIIQSGPKGRGKYSEMLSFRKVILKDSLVPERKKKKKKEKKKKKLYGLSKQSTHSSILGEEWGSALRRPYLDWEEPSL